MNGANWLSELVLDVIRAAQTRERVQACRRAARREIESRIRRLSPEARDRLSDSIRAEVTEKFDLAKYGLDDD